MISDYLSLVKYEITVKCPYCNFEHVTSKNLCEIVNCGCGNVYRTTDIGEAKICLKMGRPKENTSGEA